MADGVKNGNLNFQVRIFLTLVLNDKYGLRFLTVYGMILSPRSDFQIGDLSSHFVI